MLSSNTLKKEISAKIALAIFILFSAFWLGITLFLQPGSSYHELFAETYWVMALWGGFWGLSISHKWGGIRSVMGKATLFFSLGLLAQVFGQIAYAYYYYYLKIEAPFPSIGDIGYFGSIPLYIYAIIQLALASGVHVNLRSIQGKLKAFFLPTIGLVASYAIFLRGYEFNWSAPLKIFLDFGYPLGQAIYISLAVLTYLFSVKTLGGIMKTKVRLILLALVIQYIADYTFLYWTSQGTWYASGVNDYIYLVSYFVMTLALIQLKTVYDDLTGKTTKN